MSVGLDRTDRALLIGAAVLLIGLAFASAFLAPVRQGGRATYPSSYSTSWDGAKAAYVLLDELGYAIERWDQAPAALEGDPRSKVLILANPLQTPTKEDIAALRRFLDRGGRIVATGENAAKFLPGAHHFEENDDVEDDDTRFPAALPSPLTNGAPEISMAPPQEWQPGQTEQIVVYGDKDTAAVVTFAVGQGKVIWWGSPSPLTNRGIKKPGNLALLLNSIGPKVGQTILWDEYFHGARGNLWSYIARTPLPWVFAQFALLLAFILFSHSRRYGAIRMPGKTSRLSPLEFVDTLGDLYTTAHAGSAAVRVDYQRLRFQLSRQLGLPANVKAVELARTASRIIGWEEQPLLGSLVRAERGTHSISLDDVESLEIVQDLHHYTTLLDARRTQVEKRPQE